eukprot:scaffold5312_cov118-Isochrysis_galbana.AAC.11
MSSSPASPARYPKAARHSVGYWRRRSREPDAARRPPWWRRSRGRAPATLPFGSPRPAPLTGLHHRESPRCARAVCRAGE